MMTCLIILAIASATVMASCDGSRFCTDLACSDGLIVRFEGVRPGSFTLEVETSDGFTVIKSCGPEECGSSVFFENFTPDSVIIRLSSGTTVVESTFHPDYDDISPNGPDCGVGCRQASVVMTFPPVAGSTGGNKLDLDQ